jgi:hypothetical protein
MTVRMHDAAIQLIRPDPVSASSFWMTEATDPSHEPGASSAAVVSQSALTVDAHEPGP